MSRLLVPRPADTEHIMKDDSLGSTRYTTELNKASEACHRGPETASQLTVVIILFPLVRRNQTKGKSHKSSVCLHVTHVLIKETLYISLPDKQHLKGNFQSEQTLKHLIIIFSLYID